MEAETNSNRGKQAEKETSDQVLHQPGRRRRFLVLGCTFLLVCAVGAALAYVGWTQAGTRHTQTTLSVIEPEVGGETLLGDTKPFLPANNTETDSFYDELWSRYAGAYSLLSSAVVSLVPLQARYYDDRVWVGYFAQRYHYGKLLSEVSELSRRAAAIPDFQSQKGNITTALSEVFKWIHDQGIYNTLSEQKALQAELAASPTIGGALGTWLPNTSERVGLCMQTWRIVMIIAPDLPLLNSIQQQLYNQHKMQPSAAGTQDDGRRRLLQNYDLSFPPGFNPADPASQPALVVPMVFHVMLYRTAAGGYGPPRYEQAADYVDRLVQIVNMMATVSKFQFTVLSVHNDPDQYPYLVYPNYDAWVTCAPDFNQPTCAYANENIMQDLIRSSVVSFPRAINVYLSGDPNSKDSALGYAYVPSSTDDPWTGHIWLRWDVADVRQSNQQLAYESGAQTLWHETMHHLGVFHTFGQRRNGCGDDDGNTDTPDTAGPVWSQSFASQAELRCQQIFNIGLQGNWDSVYSRWRTSLGIPSNDMNSFADSCPNQPGYDELGNYMTYTYPVCIPALGHFTAQQVARMHQVTASSNPWLYRWGQYYATSTSANMLPPSPPSPPRQPPPPSPPPVSHAPPPPSTGPVIIPDICKYTRQGCQCKDWWTYGGVLSSGCGNPDQDPNGYWCAVDADCSSAPNGWDYCQAAAATTCAPENACTYTTSGCECTSQCASPDNDPLGNWCAISSSCATANTSKTLQGGGLWDYCNCNSECAQTTDCPCFPVWEYGGVTNFGCASPDNDPNGLWCFTYGCTTRNGGYWDYCSSTADQACSTIPQVASTSPPPSPPPPPRPPADPCKDTVDGCRCLDSWYYETIHLHGCANPDNDPSGPWCLVEEECTGGQIAFGTQNRWDYCTAAASSCLRPPPAAPSPPSTFSLQPSPPPAGPRTVLIHVVLDNETPSSLSATDRSQLLAGLSQLLGQDVSNFRVTQLTPLDNGALDVVVSFAAASQQQADAASAILSSTNAKTALQNNLAARNSPLSVRSLSEGTPSIDRGTKQKDSSFPVGAVVGGVVGGVALLLAAALLAYCLCCRRAGARGSASPGAQQAVSNPPAPPPSPQYPAPPPPAAYAPPSPQYPAPPPPGAGHTVNPIYAGQQMAYAVPMAQPPQPHNGAQPMMYAMPMGQVQQPQQAPQAAMAPQGSPQMVPWQTAQGAPQYYHMPQAGTPNASQQSFYMAAPPGHQAAAEQPGMAAHTEK